MRLPDVTNKIPTTELFIDATPDENYPIRILEHFLERAKEMWVIDGEDTAFVYRLMNEAQRIRQQILTKAIERLKE